MPMKNLLSRDRQCFTTPSAMPIPLHTRRTTSPASNSHGTSNPISEGEVSSNFSLDTLIARPHNDKTAARPKPAFRKLRDRPISSAVLFLPK
jgi:hypothetical protein